MLLFWILLEYVHQSLALGKPDLTNIDSCTYNDLFCHGYSHCGRVSTRFRIRRLHNMCLKPLNSLIVFPDSHSNLVVLPSSGDGFTGTGVTKLTSLAGVKSSDLGRASGERSATSSLSVLQEKLGTAWTQE